MASGFYFFKVLNFQGTDTGHRFLELFKLLVINSNECESCGEWDLGAPLIQLPLSEQIVVLHRCIPLKIYIFSMY